MSTTRESGESFLLQWVRLVRRRRAWAGAVFLAVFGLAALVLVFARPVYRAKARLRLGDPPPASGVSPNTGILSFFQLGGDAFSNDLELFGSRTLAEGLVDDLALNVVLDAPRAVHRATVLARLAASRQTSKATFRVNWVEPSRVSVERVAPSDSVIGSFETGSTAVFGGVRAVFLPRAEGRPEEVEVRTVPFGEALRSTENGIGLTRPRREANVLEVTYTDEDPDLAEAVVREGVGRFLAMRAELVERESAETVDSLRTVAEGTRAELDEANAAIEALQRETGLVAPDAQSEALIQRYERSIGELETARAELEALDTQLARVGEARNRVDAWTTLVAHPRFLDNQTVGGILGRLTELQASLTDVASRKAPGSRDVRTLEQQIEQLDGALRTIALEFRGALSGQVEDLEGRVAEMSAALARVPQTVLELGRRQLSARLLSELLVITEQRLRQEEIRQALTFSNVQVIDPAAVEYRPIWPRTKVGLVVGFILALGSALLSVVVVELADAAVRTEDDLRRAGVGPIVGVLVGRGGSVDGGAAAALAHAFGEGPGVLVAATEGLDTARIVETITAAGIEGTAVRPSAGTFSGAVQAARVGAPIVLTVEAGRTRKADVSRALRNLHEAGGTVVGVFVLARSAREAAALRS